MNKPFCIVHEDNHLLIAVKAPGVPSQSDPSLDPDMLTLLKAYLKEKYHKPGEVYLGLVHRLDRPVGGLMAFARTGKAAARLSQQLREHQMEREYLAVCQGELAGAFSLTDYLVKNGRTNHVTVANAKTPNAKIALLHGEAIKAKDGMTLVRIRLETGRSHQIRVQMSHMGHPLMGDLRYGSGQRGDQIALWGYRLSLTHPTRNQKMVFSEAPHGGAFDAFREDLDAQTL